PSAAHRWRAGREPSGLPREGHRREDLKPNVLLKGGDVAHRSSHDAAQPREVFEGRIDLQKTMVDRPSLVVEEDLDDAEPLVDRVEQRAVALLAGPQGVLDALPFGDVDAVDEDAADRTVGIAQRLVDEVGVALRALALS